MPDPSALSRPELLHRDHVVHELIDGDLGALVKARRFVFLDVCFIPVQRREDVARAGSHGFHRNDGGDRNVIKDGRTIAGEQHRGPDKALRRNNVQETAEVRDLLTVARCDLDAEDAARSHVHFGSRHTPPSLGHVPLLEMLRLRQRFPDEPRGSVDEPFDGEVEFRIEGEFLAHDRIDGGLLAHDPDSFSLSCLTYWSNWSSRASHNRRRAVSHSSTTLKRSGAISYVRTRPRFFDLISRLCSSTERCCTNDGSCMSNGAASSLTVAGPTDSCSRTLRRVGLARA